MTLFNEIEEAREVLGLKAKEVEQYLGLSVGAYSRWKRGVSSTDKSAVIALRAAACLPFDAPPQPTYKGFQRGKDGKRVKLAFSAARVPSDRSIKMKQLYVEGHTLREIGEIYGVSRERVRQILTLDFGITAEDGGATASNERKKSTKREAYADKIRSKFGCTPSQYNTLRTIGDQMIMEGYGKYRTPTYAFVQQRNSARARGIEWSLTLWEWWSVWQASGKWDKRGRSGYVMARHGDVGPYSKDNVKIITSGENSSEANNRNGLPMGVSATRSGRFLAFRYGKRIGVFDTVEEAREAFLKAYKPIEQVAA